MTALANTAAASLENVTRRARAKRTHQDLDPVVIIGFWRSGTTMLHDLLCADPRFLAPTTVQCFFPASYRAAVALAPLIRWLLPDVRPMDTVSLELDRPQEDEIAMLNLGLPSLYRVFAFPSLFRSLSSDAFAAFRQPDTQWLDQWTSFLSTIESESPGRTLLLKSPGHTWRIAAIRDRFAGAKFVHLTRDPQQQIASAIKMFSAMADSQALEREVPPLDVIAKFVLSLHEDMYRSFFEAASSVGGSEMVHIRYEDLLDNPTRELGRIYEELDLTGFSQLEPALEEVAKNCDRHPVDRYSVSNAWRDEVARRTARYREVFGYE